MPVDNPAATSPRDYHVDVQLRWGDMDAYRHINNVEFLRILEEARVRSLREWFADDPVARTGIVVGRHEIDYLSVLHYRPEPVRIFMWVSRIGASGYDITYVIGDPDTQRREDVGRPYAAAETSLVFIDADSGRARRVSAQERAELEPWVGPAAPLRRNRGAGA